MYLHDEWIGTKACYRTKEEGETEWQCWNDHTGCLYNDGHNICSHPHKTSKFPLRTGKRGVYAKRR